MIQNEKLNSFLVNRFHAPLWLAAESKNESLLQWSDGTAFNISKLKNDENVGVSSDTTSDTAIKCLSMTKSGAWKLVSCQTRLSIVCHKKTSELKEDKKE